MKVNSEHLYKYINELATNQKVKFKVYYDDSYVTEILWNGENFVWETGTLTSEAFFNPLYDFEVIEEDKKIEKIIINSQGNIEKKLIDGSRIVLPCVGEEVLHIAYKVNELIDVVNKLKGE